MRLLQFLRRVAGRIQCTLFRMTAARAFRAGEQAAERRNAVLAIEWSAQADGLQSRLLAAEEAVARSIQHFNKNLREWQDDKAELISKHDGQVRELKTQIASLTSEVEIKAKQVELMSDVVTRDRERVIAESAIYSRQKNEAENSQRPIPFTPGRAG